MEFEASQVKSKQDVIPLEQTDEAASPTYTKYALSYKWLWHPYIIVFVSSACIMILELVAGRIIAPYVGVSLYTWTSVIGVVLAGISLGNYVGGWLADRYASLRLLGSIFALAGLTSFSILAVSTCEIVSLSLSMSTSCSLAMASLWYTIDLISAKLSVMCCIFSSMMFFASFALSTRALVFWTSASIMVKCLS